MRKKIIILAVSICVFSLCYGCGVKTDAQLGEKKNVGTENEKQTVGVDGLVTMSAELTEDEVSAVKCIIYNKTKKKIETGENYSLQALKDGSFVDLKSLPGHAYNLELLGIDPGRELSYKADIGYSYGDLPAGRYRIVKKYRYASEGKDAQEDDAKGEETVTEEFDLP